MARYAIVEPMGQPGTVVNIVEWDGEGGYGEAVGAIPVPDGARVQIGDEWDGQDFIAVETPPVLRLLEPLIRVEDKPVSGKVLAVNTYETDNGDGTFSGLAQTESYEWSGNRVISKTTTAYLSDSSVAATMTENYSTTSDGQAVTRRG